MCLSLDRYKKERYVVLHRIREFPYKFNIFYIHTSPAVPVRLVDGLRVFLKIFSSLCMYGCDVCNSTHASSVLVLR